MGIVPTVRIKAEEGFVVINKADLNLTIHELYVEEPKKPKKPEGSEGSEPGKVETTTFGSAVTDMTIEEALQSLTIGSEADFTGSGSPRVARVEEILGRDVTANEVKAAWESLQEVDKG